MIDDKKTSLESKENISDKDKMVNVQPPSKFIAIYWGFDLSPPSFIHLNYSSK
jgi:hypothetical protein